MGLRQASWSLRGYCQTLQTWIGLGTKHDRDPLTCSNYVNKYDEDSKHPSAEGATP